MLESKNGNSYQVHTQLVADLCRVHMSEIKTNFFWNISETFEKFSTALLQKVVREVEHLM